MFFLIHKQTNKSNRSVKFQFNCKTVNKNKGGGE